MRHFWDAAVDLDPQAAAMDEGVRFPMCNPQAQVALFCSAALIKPEVTAIDIPTRFASLDGYWQPFLGDQGRRRPTPCQ